MDKIAATYRGRESKITSTAVKQFVEMNPIGYKCETIDNINILQSLLLTQLPPERISGVINLFVAITTNLTENDLENTLVRS